MKTTGIICLAFLAGIAGGIVSFKVLQSREPVQTNIRAQRFELVNDEGKTLSYWGRTKTETVLAFVEVSNDAVMSNKSGSSSHSRLILGVDGDSSPIFETYGHDFKPRVRMLMNEFDRPSLLMDDETGAKVLLGVQQSDTPSLDKAPRPWVLSFLSDGDGPKIGVYPVGDDVKSKWNSTLSLPRPDKPNQRWSPF